MIAYHLEVANCCHLIDSDQLDAGRKLLTRLICLSLTSLALHYSEVALLYSFARE